MNLENMDCIEINELKIAIHIGLHSWEKQTTQNIAFNIKLYLNLSDCAENIDNTVCYQTICDDLTSHFTKQPLLLLETVAMQTIELLLQNAKVKAAEVKVKKSHIIKNCQDVAIVMRRCKSEL